MNFYGHKGLDKFLYEKYFLNQTHGLVIEAGAIDGLIYSNSKTLEEIGWKCVNVEPNPVEFAKLVINRPNSINVNAGLLDQNGTAIFEVRGKAKNGHVNCERAVLECLRTLGPDVSRRFGTTKSQVRIMTYATLIEEFNVKEVDLFVLDVEGLETQVIQGMRGCSVLPKVFCIENLMESLKPDTPNYYEKLIDETLGGKYRKDSSCWLNDIYIRRD